MQDSKQLIEQVEAIVSPVYLVGGSVRDIILGRTPKDYDFTTPLSPDEVELKVRVAKRKPYTIGKKFGTIGFKVADQLGNFQYVEVTTFRRESYQAGNRKPEVEFVSDLIEDLSRRDFTMNAIALDKDEYFDPFGGRIDILAKKIKTVGKPKERFTEDPLRMLRVARFASQLNFDIDPNIIGVSRKMASQILNISKERWIQEIDKILLSSEPAKGLGIIKDMGLMKYMLPEVSVLHADHFHDTLMAVMEAPESADLRWKALLSQIGKPASTLLISDDIKQTYRNHELVAREMAIGICSRLKFSNERTKIILS